MTSDGLARLGELRRRQGRLDEAASLFDRSGGHPIATLGRAAIVRPADRQTAIELAESTCGACRSRTAWNVRPRSSC